MKILAIIPARKNSKGLTNKINEGNKVKTDIIASNIARPVKIPK